MSKQENTLEDIVNGQTGLLVVVFIIVLIVGMFDKCDSSIEENIQKEEIKYDEISALDTPEFPVQYDLNKEYNKIHELLRSNNFSNSDLSDPLFSEVLTMLKIFVDGRSYVNGKRFIHASHNRLRGSLLKLLLQQDLEYMPNILLSRNWNEIIVDSLYFKNDTCSYITLQKIKADFISIDNSEIDRFDFSQSVVSEIYIEDSKIGLLKDMHNDDERFPKINLAICDSDIRMEINKPIRKLDLGNTSLRNTLVSSNIKFLVLTGDIHIEEESEFSSVEHVIWDVQNLTSAATITIIDSEFRETPGIYHCQWVQLGEKPRDKNLIEEFTWTPWIIELDYNSYCSNGTLLNGNNYVFSWTGGMDSTIYQK
ncbi:MAG: hypothetical protein HKN86_03270 [Acidimicrobiia bacterium]|nr:hypothetical protein [Acidimicrobiia bacterium]